MNTCIHGEYTDKGERSKTAKCGLSGDGCPFMNRWAIETNPNIYPRVSLRQWMCGKFEAIKAKEAT